MNFLKAVFMLFILLLFLASCLPTSQAPLPVETPTQPLTQAPTQAIPSPQDAPMLPPQAAQEAADALAARLDIPVEQVTIAQIDSVDWPNACLGVQKPDQACAEVITPGYRVTLAVGSDTYVYHTDATGEQIIEASGK